MPITPAMTGKATSDKTLFRRETAVGININAKPEVIWQLLTDAAGMTAWNSTLISVTGSITLNSTIQLKSKLAPERTFNLRITELNKPQQLVWSDGAAPMFKGVRTYTLMPKADGTTDFSMVEVISGVMLPLIGGSLPDFKPNFEQIAADLKRAAEKK